MTASIGILGMFDFCYFELMLHEAPSLNNGSYRTNDSSSEGGGAGGT